MAEERHCEDHTEILNLHTCLGIADEQHDGTERSEDWKLLTEEVYSLMLAQVPPCETLNLAPATPDRLSHATFVAGIFFAGAISTPQCSSSQQERAHSGAMRLESGLRQPSGAGSPLSQTTLMQGTEQ